MYQKDNITSIAELVCKGGRNLTPIFKGSQFPVLVFVTDAEFKKVKGDNNAMKDLAILKLNNL